MSRKTSSGSSGTESCSDGSIVSSIGTGVVKEVPMPISVAAIEYGYAVGLVVDP